MGSDSEEKSEEKEEKKKKKILRGEPTFSRMSFNPVALKESPPKKTKSQESEEKASKGDDSPPARERERSNSLASLNKSGAGAPRPLPLPTLPQPMKTSRQASMPGGHFQSPIGASHLANRVGMSVDFSAMGVRGPLLNGPLSSFDFPTPPEESGEGEGDGDGDRPTRRDSDPISALSNDIAALPRTRTKSPTSSKPPNGLS